MIDYLADALDDEQLKAALDIDGPTLIYSGAGGGKSRVVVYRVSHMIDSGVDPDNILCFTFTNKAASELQERLKDLVGKKADNLWVGTFHSTCVKLLRTYGIYGGIKPGFCIIDDSDAVKIICDIIKDMGYPMSKNLTPLLFRREISKIKCKLIKLVDYRAQATKQHSKLFADLVCNVFTDYTRELSRMNVMDFDDLIVRTIHLINSAPSVKRAIQDRFRYICVDEYQDTALAESVLVRQLSSGTGNLCVVGDPQQAIYGFRNTDYKIIMNFKDIYTDASVHILNRNYRSARRIVESSSRVVANNTIRPDYSYVPHKKDLGLVKVNTYDRESDEAADVAQLILDMVSRHEYNYSDFAILYRANALARPLEEAFLGKGVPYVLAKSTEFYSRQEIKDVAAFLMLLMNEDYDSAAERAIKTWHGIGEATVGKLRDYATDLGISILRLLKRKRPTSITASAWNRLIDFYSRLTGVREAFTAGATIQQIISKILTDMHLRDYLMSCKSSEERLDNIDKLIQLSDAMGDGPANILLEPFMEKLALNAIDDDSENSESVKLMTIHQAKGLEFPVVFVVGCEEGLLPHRKSISSVEDLEEERRLCYVAMTRAIDKLYMSSVATRCIFGKYIRAAQSRFIREFNQ